MAAKIACASRKTRRLADRLTILEKFIELKSNECAYYRTKVHLMQMSPIQSISKPPSLPSASVSSSCSTIDSNPSRSIDDRQRRGSVPLRSTPRSILRQKARSSCHLRSEKVRRQGKNEQRLPLSSAVARSTSEQRGCAIGSDGTNVSKENNNEKRRPQSELLRRGSPVEHHESRRRRRRRVPVSFPHGR